MKKLFAIIAVLSICIPTYAQKFGATIEGGVTVSQIDGDDLSGYHKFGYSFGASVNRYLYKDILGAEIGIKYLLKGSKAHDLEVHDFYEANLHYAEIPLIAFYRITNFYIDLGLSFGYLFKAQEDTDGYGFKKPQYKFRKIDLSGVVGARYSITKNILIGGHLNYSLLAIRQHYTSQETYIIDGQHNNLINFSLQYVLK